MRAIIEIKHQAKEVNLYVRPSVYISCSCIRSFKGSHNGVALAAAVSGHRRDRVYSRIFGGAVKDLCLDNPQDRSLHFTFDSGGIEDGGTL